MSDPSIFASEDMEKGSTNSVQKIGVTDVLSTAVNPEYQRYLDLHVQFEGAGRRKLVRKRKSPPLLVVIILFGLRD